MHARGARFDRRGPHEVLDRSWNSIQADPAAHPRVNHSPGRSQEHRLERLATDLDAARSVASLLHPSVG